MLDLTCWQNNFGSGASSLCRSTRMHVVYPWLCRSMQMSIVRNWQNCQTSVSTDCGICTDHKADQEMHAIGILDLDCQRHSHHIHCLFEIFQLNNG